MSHQDVRKVLWSFMGNEFFKRKLNKGARSAESMSGEKPNYSSLPNSLVQRMMQEPEAEREADRLSQNITSQTPNDVMREMGSRMGADFSDIRFHTDPASAAKAEALDARAWTQGRDVYFGKGGFDPSVAAHELVHTVQQGAAKGNTAQSMPMGTVQMKPSHPDDQTEEGEIDPDIKIDSNTDICAALTQVFNTPNGDKIYKALESDLFKLIKKGAGRRFKRCEKTAGIQFLAFAAEKDYAGKEILEEILKRSTATDHFARKRLFDFQEFVEFLSSRLREFDLEEAAMEANVMADPPKFAHKEQKLQRNRAYESEVPGKDSEDSDFNPNNDPELAKVQDEIENAANPQQAYAAFGRFTGNNRAKYVNKLGSVTNLDALKKKLKNMTRVIRDYPELQKQIGNMNVMDDSKDKTYMGAVGTFGGKQKASLHYNVYYDRPEGEEKRNERFLQPGYLAGNKDTAGVHELGHVLASTLIDTDNYADSSLEQNSEKHESSIMESVLSNQEIMPKERYENLKRYTQEDVDQNKTKKGTPKRVLNAIHSKYNGLYTEQYAPSRYGVESPGEFFAESIHDVYANGNKAKKTSIAMVKEYEKRQKELTKKKFFRKKRSLLRRFLNWIKM